MTEEKKLRLTEASSPHVASPIDTTNLMRDVLIALVPAMVMGVVFFGPRALVATIISVLACEFFEWGYRKLMHKSCAVKDLSAAVTGVLLAFVCAPTLPYWMLIIGDFFAIVVVKQLFGGLGKNFMNPALGGRAFLMLCYPVAMTTWVAPGIGTGAWDALLGDGADSEGLALTFQLLSGKMEVGSVLVEGTLNGEPHFWNQLTADGGAHYVDLTRDASGTTYSAADLLSLGYVWEGAEENAENLN